MKLTPIIACIIMSFPAFSAGNDISFEGSWTFRLGDFYFGNPNGDYFSAEMTAVENGDTIRFIDPAGNIFPISATFDAESSGFLFPAAFTGEYTFFGMDYDLYQQPFNNPKHQFDLPAAEMLAGRYNPENGTIEFPEKTMGLSWNAYNSSRFMGYMDVLYFDSAKFNDFIIPEVPDAGAITVPEDDVEHPVTYYTLQGLKISAPRKGEPTIEVAGSKVTKIIP